MLLKQEAESKHVDLSGDDAEALDCLLSFVYIYTYRTPRTVSNEGVHHAKVYAIADKYEVDGLRKSAMRQFKALFTVPRLAKLDENTRLLILESVYTLTPDSNLGLREIVKRAMKSWCNPWETNWVSSWTDIPYDQPTIESVHEGMVAADIVFEVRRLATMLYGDWHDLDYANECVKVLLYASSTMDIMTFITTDGMEQRKRFCDLAFETEDAYHKGDVPEYQVLVASRAEAMHEIMRDFEATPAFPTM